MSEVPADYVVKYIVVGSISVGKTSILYRFTENKFAEKYQPTFGIEFSVKTETIGDTGYRLQLWDTAGAEEFHSLTKGYYKNATCSLLVYSISDRNTFDDIKDWIEEANTYANENMIKVLVGNKSDLEDKREVTKMEAECFAKEKDMLFFEVSAKENINIEDVFLSSLKQIDLNLRNNIYDLDSNSSPIKKYVRDSRDSNLSTNKLKTHKKSKKCC